MPPSDSIVRGESPNPGSLSKGARWPRLKIPQSRLDASPPVAGPCKGGAHVRKRVVAKGFGIRERRSRKRLRLPPGELTRNGMLGGHQNRGPTTVRDHTMEFRAF